MGSGNSKTAPPVSAPPVPHHFVLTTSANQNQKASAQGCRFFLEGRCRFGDSCNHPHVARKTVSRLPIISSTVSDRPVQESQRVSTVDYHNSLTTHSSPQSTEQHNSLHTPENRPARTAQAPSVGLWSTYSSPLLTILCRQHLLVFWLMAAYLAHSQQMRIPKTLKCSSNRTNRQDRL